MSSSHTTQHALKSTNTSDWLCISVHGEREIIRFYVDHVVRHASIHTVFKIGEFSADTESYETSIIYTYDDTEL